MKTRLIIGGVFAVVVATPAIGAKKPWDVERYVKCIVHDGANELDPVEMFSSRRCSQYDDVDHTTGGISEIDLDRFVAFGRKKDGSTPWVGNFYFDIEYERGETIIGGDAAGGLAGFERITFLIDGKLEELPLVTARVDPGRCGTMGHGWMRVTTCSYDESVYFPISDELLAKARANVAHGVPLIKSKLFARDGSTFETDLYLTEIIAVADRIVADPRGKP